MLRLSRCLFKGPLQFSRSFLSHEFKDVNKLLPFSVDSNQQYLDKFINIETPNNYVGNSILSSDEWQTDLCNKLLENRLNSNATKYEANFAVVLYIIAKRSIKEFLAIFQDPLHYGVFLDNYTASYVLNYLVEEKEYEKAVLLSIKLKNQDCFHIRLTSTLLTKAYFEYIKVCPPEEAVAKDDADSNEVKRVRVKYVRNVPIIPEHQSSPLYVVGEIILRTNYESEIIKCNLNLLGFLLTGQHTACEKLLALNNKLFRTDVLNLCLELMKKRSIVSHELQSAIENAIENSTNENFDNALDIYISNIAQKEESIILKQQKEIYSRLLSEYDSILNKEREKREHFKRQMYIENILKDVEQQTQRLWVFPILNKSNLQVRGKRDSKVKSKQKDIDAEYIPPEVQKKYT